MNRYLAAMLVAGLCYSPSRAAGPEAELAAKAQKVLQNACFRCHGENGAKEGGFNYVLDIKQMIERKKIVPGDPAKSKLFKRISQQEMPPEGEKPQPSAGDIAVIKQWIEAGAPAFPEAAKAAARAFQGEAHVLTALRDHLRALDEEDRPFQRYFTLTHLANNPKVSDEDLIWQRAAFAKLANSLSWKPRIVVPKAVDKEETVFNVDLRDLGWDRRGLWNEVLRAYPYGLKFNNHPDDALRRLAREVEQLIGCDLPYVRADWFVATASRPPLYHVLLDLPTHARVLEQRLQVNVAENFLRDKLARAGFAKSGVSSQNRMIERHVALYGYYWKSYDFKSNDGKSNLFQNPLGPGFKGNPFADQAFEHAGGEIIFTLPNKLQGYLLVNNKDQRIDEGPTDVVSDGNKTSGTAAIVNGLSCMACHKNGMIREGFRDEVRDGQGVGGHSRSKVQRLYPREAEMAELLKVDEDLFVTALDAAIGPFFKKGGLAYKDVRDLTDEPIGKVARHYVKDLTLEEAAYELGLPDPKLLLGAIQTNDRLRQLGLGTLTKGGLIKRDAWSSLKSRLSPFQRAAFELDHGSPHVPF
jgi:serine/threonine-protein kinase